MTGFQIRVNEDGQDRVYPLYCHSSDYCTGVLCEQDLKKISLNYSKSGSIQLDFLEDKNFGDYAFFSLVNKKLSFDMDVSCVRKNHNFAFYSSALTKWDVYRDAQSWDSRTEMDFVECNRTAYHFTAHKSFDKGGGMIMGTGGTIQRYNPDQMFRCTEPIDRNELYGPGKYIDTNHPFHVEITFRTDNVHLDISQDGKNIYQDAGGEYMQSLLSELYGRRHTFVISLWSGDMDWLDGNLPYYDESWIQEVKAWIANITITSI